MTDRLGQSTEKAAPESREEAAEIIRGDPALGDQTDQGAMVDDDARTDDDAQSGEVHDG
jgi:hypothetical protein